MRANARYRKGKMWSIDVRMFYRYFIFLMYKKVYIFFFFTFYEGYKSYIYISYMMLVKMSEMLCVLYKFIIRIPQGHLIFWYFMWYLLTCCIKHFSSNSVLLAFLGWHHERNILIFWRAEHVIKLDIIETGFETYNKYFWMYPRLLLGIWILKKSYNRL
jgi:hypothetical protein